MFLLERMTLTFCMRVTKYGNCKGGVTVLGNGCGIIMDRSAFYCLHNKAASKLTVYSHLQLSY